jgi:histidyl-tRNA synthetase
VVGVRGLGQQAALQRQRGLGHPAGAGVQRLQQVGAQVADLRALLGLPRLGAVAHHLAPAVEGPARRQPDAVALALALGADPRAAEGIDELAQITAALAASGIDEGSYRIDLAMIRGLDYYTGPIFETVVEEPKIGSISGGGRYDGLIGLLSGRDVPATGVSIGFERIMDVIEELGLQPPELKRTVSEVLVTIFDQGSVAASLGLARELREAGLRTEIALTGDRLGNQLKYASRRGIPYAAILGPDEVAAGEVVLKELASGEQVKLPRASVVGELRRRRRADRPDS